MAESKPIPVRLDAELIHRLDLAADRLGNTRTGIIRLCLASFLDHFERHGEAATLPLNWRDILAHQDGRTRRGRSPEPAYGLNESPSTSAPSKPRPSKSTSQSTKTTGKAPNPAYLSEPKTPRDSSTGSTSK